MMKLLTIDIETIYHDWKNKPLNLDQMKKMYSIDETRDLVYFVCDIKFPRGGKFFEDGLLTFDDYNLIFEHLCLKKEPINLGEVNGKHSDVDAYESDFQFFYGCESQGRQQIEKYMLRKGLQTCPSKSNDIFWPILYPENY